MVWLMFSRSFLALQITQSCLFLYAFKIGGYIGSPSWFHQKTFNKFHKKLLRVVSFFILFLYAFTYEFLLWLAIQINLCSVVVIFSIWRRKSLDGFYRCTEMKILSNFLCNYISRFSFTIYTDMQYAYNTQRQNETAFKDDSKRIFSLVVKM